LGFPDDSLRMTDASYQFLRLDVADRIATLTVNRPDKLNALNDATMAELRRAIGQLRSDAAVGGIIVTGAGRAFVAGADIAELRSKSSAEAQDLARRGQETFRLFETSPKPVVAAVNGFALGGGCELAMACHVRVASDIAKFGQPEVKLGVIPGYGGTQRLTRLVGRARALQLLLTGEMVDAAEALRIGLVNRVVAAGESVVEAARALLQQMLANAPLALAQCIEVVNRGSDLPLDEALALEARVFGALTTSADMREGTSAFLEKRAPSFSGR
jgi:enoyl-CoA hydratase